MWLSSRQTVLACCGTALLPKRTRTRATAFARRSRSRQPSAAARKTTSTQAGGARLHAGLRVHATASRSDGNGAGAADAVSLSDRAQRTLREAILRGDIAPGTKLLITDTAAQLGVSPIPLREALRALEAEGLVDISAHRGAQVRPLSRSDMESIYALRVDLDGMATRLACERNEPGWLEHVKECLNELAVISPENRDRDNTEQ